MQVLTLERKDVVAGAIAPVFGNPVQTLEKLRMAHLGQTVLFVPEHPVFTGPA
ncbi:hypothetical protein D9M68_498190 [compost metagenome]